MSLSQHAFGATPGWRWLSARVWGLEHAFERARAKGRAEDDTRIRIFFVLALFTGIFICLAFGATHAALFAHPASGDASADQTACNGLLARDPQSVQWVPRGRVRVEVGHGASFVQEFQSPHPVSMPACLTAPQASPHRQ